MRVFSHKSRARVTGLMIGLDIHYACKVDDAMLRILSIFFRCQNGSARMSSLRAPFRMRPIELSAAPTRRNKMAEAKQRGHHLH